MPTQSLTSAGVETVRVHIFGRVQGVGLRPVAVRLAERFQLSGSVANTPDGLELVLCGSRAAIDEYLAAFPSQLPPGAAIERLECKPDDICERSGFQIIESRREELVAAPVPLDAVACSECRQEICDPRERRFQFPLTSCTDCGPRYSIIAAMPYDRAATAMHKFGMCQSCSREYRSGADRRFHAQTIACEECGPKMWFVDQAGRQLHGPNVLPAVAEYLREEKIVAIKGLGGYQLLADATSPTAVRRLRDRKGRAHKPLAVLVGSLAEARRLAKLNTAEERMLLDRGGPIVIVSMRSDSPLTSAVAAEFHSVGLMLPTTPLHALMCDLFGRPLICTSGNREGEPLAYREVDAETALAGIADAWLHHDRPILRPIDDSVVRIIAGEPCFLRLARGYAPQSLPFTIDCREPLIALGGELKTAIALYNGKQAVLGPHVGDLTNAAVCERWADQLAALAGLYGVPLDEASFVHDAHPQYFSTTWARSHARRRMIQHHHAHIAAVLLEHGEVHREVLGLAWDGTGYGDDGTIWGGECLLASLRHYRRIARLRTIPLLGGEQAVREPWRLAIALVGEALGTEVAAQLGWPEVPPAKAEAVLGLLKKPRLSPKASSMGRLFDGVAALTLGIAYAFDEGRPAMLLEAACNRDAQGEYSFDFDEHQNEIDWRGVIAAVVADVQRQTLPGTIAMRFHRAVGNLAAAIADKYPTLPLVTGGGVFQNAIVIESIAERLASRRQLWLRPRQLPPGDGGLAAGQLAIAAACRHSEL